VAEILGPGSGVLHRLISSNLDTRNPTGIDYGAESLPPSKGWPETGIWTALRAAATGEAAAQLCQTSARPLNQGPVPRLSLRLVRLRRQQGVPTVVDRAGHRGQK
jgi:hypothetical protein